MARDDTQPKLSNKVIHERTRLLILTALASAESNDASFSELRDKLELTAGNLSVQLKRLKQAGYVSITKRFKDDKPLTTAHITPQGSKALSGYLNEMENIIRALRG